MEFLFYSLFFTLSKTTFNRKNTIKMIDLSSSPFAMIFPTIEIKISKTKSWIFVFIRFGNLFCTKKFYLREEKKD